MRNTHMQKKKKTIQKRRRKKQQNKSETNKYTKKNKQTLSYIFIVYNIARRWYQCLVVVKWILIVFEVVSCWTVASCVLTTRCCRKKKLFFCSCLSSLIISLSTLSCNLLFFVPLLGPAAVVGVMGDIVWSSSKGGVECGASELLSCVSSRISPAPKLCSSCIIYKFQLVSLEATKGLKNVTLSNKYH